MIPEIFLKGKKSPTPHCVGFAWIGAVLAWFSTLVIDTGARSIFFKESIHHEMHESKATF